MACPNCGGETAPNDLFCASCGTNLAEAPVTCPNCSKVNEPKASFCTACGTNLKSPVEPVADGAPAEETAPQQDQPTPEAKAATAAAPVAESAAPPASSTEVGSASRDKAPDAVESPQAVPTPAATTSVPAAAEAAAAAASAAAPDTKSPLRVSLGAAAVAALGALLAWIDLFGQSSNSFDSPMQFLIDWETSASSTISIGFVVLALAGVAAAMAWFSTAPNRIWLIRFMGLALVAVAAAFLVQLAQAADSIGASFGDVYGVGPFFTLVGGAVLMAGK